MSGFNRDCHSLEQGCFLDSSARRPTTNELLWNCDAEDYKDVSLFRTVVGKVSGIQASVLIIF
jgi:hypothetical protein